MKKRGLLITSVLFLMTACGNEKQTANIKIQNDISIKEETQESMESIDLWEPSDMRKSSKQNILNFTTGLQIVLPESWNDKIIIEIEPRTEEYGGGLIVCEKSNAEANAGGVLFYLKYYLKNEDDIGPFEIFYMDKVLGVYKVDGEEYALILELPREMNYLEGSDEMQEAYEKLSDSVDEVQIKTDNIIGFTRCEIDDVGWIKYG